MILQPPAGNFESSAQWLPIDSRVGTSHARSTLRVGARVNWDLERRSLLLFHGGWIRLPYALNCAPNPLNPCKLLREWVHCEATRKGSRIRKQLNAEHLRRQAKCLPRKCTRPPEPTRAAESFAAAASFFDAPLLGRSRQDPTCRARSPFGSHRWQMSRLVTESLQSTAILAKLAHRCLAGNR